MQMHMEMSIFDKKNLSFSDISLVCVKKNQKCCVVTFIEDRKS